MEVSDDDKSQQQTVLTCDPRIPEERLHCQKALHANQDKASSKPPLEELRRLEERWRNKQDDATSKSPPGGRKRPEEQQYKSIPVSFVCITSAKRQLRAHHFMECCMQQDQAWSGSSPEERKRVEEERRVKEERRARHEAERRKEERAAWQEANRQAKVSLKSQAGVETKTGLSVEP